MASRINLQHELEAILGSKNVYFQPPNGYKLTYPCIIYRLAGKMTNHANNHPYLHGNRYSVTVIDTNPESPYPDKIGEMPTCSFDRLFIADNLYHYTYSIWY